MARAFRAPLRDADPRLLLSAGRELQAFALGQGKLIETPYDVNPVVDQTGEHAAEGQSGKVWFLAGNFGGETVRTVTVPTGKALYFPITTYGAWEPTDGNTEEELLATAKFYTDAVTELECTVDGVALRDLYTYRVMSPFGAFGPNDMTDVPNGSDLLVADGYWLLLAPLSASQHVIEFSAVLGPPDDPWFWLHVKYNVTVEGN